MIEFITKLPLEKIIKFVFPIFKGRIELYFIYYKNYRNGRYRNYNKFLNLFSTKRENLFKEINKSTSISSRNSSISTFTYYLGESIFRKLDDIIILLEEILLDLKLFNIYDSDLFNLDCLKNKLQKLKKDKDYFEKNPDKEFNDQNNYFLSQSAPLLDMNNNLREIKEELEKIKLEIDLKVGIIKNTKGS